MKIIKSLNEREIELLSKIDIHIEDREYDWEEIEELKEKIVLEGEISSMDKNENPTSLSEEYSNLVDKFIEFEDEY
jgi:hypothetical protein